MSTEHILSATRKTFQFSGTIGANVPVKLDPANPGFVLKATAATDIVIGTTHTDNTADGRVGVILSAPVKTMRAATTTAIGDFLVLDGSDFEEVTPQAINLAGANMKWSVGIGLEAASAADAEISVLQLTGFIPVT